MSKLFLCAFSVIVLFSASVLSNDSVPVEPEVVISESIEVAQCSCLRCKRKAAIAARRAVRVNYRQAVKAAIYGKRLQNQAIRAI